MLVTLVWVTQIFKFVFDKQPFDRTFFWFISVFGSWGFHLAYGGFTPSFSSWNIG